jgi:MoaA/NifB/PqqE/SkfB family radical SAM enzyme
VSLDGTSRETYAAIRGLDAFDKVCEGIQAAAAAGLRASVRVTLQRANYREMPAFIDLAHRLGVREISFLAVDLANTQAFGRTGDFATDMALTEEDLPVLAEIICTLERDYAEDFRSGFIAESARKLRRIQSYFAAVRGLRPFPRVRCNAPDFSAVIGAEGRVSPCFFIAGPRESVIRSDLEQALNGDPLVRLREDIRAGTRQECARCVCSMWREPEARAGLNFLPAAHESG